MTYKPKENCKQAENRTVGLNSYAELKQGNIPEKENVSQKHTNKVIKEGERKTHHKDCVKMVFCM